MCIQSNSMDLEQGLSPRPGPTKLCKAVSIILALSGFASFALCTFYGNIQMRAEGAMPVSDCALAYLVAVTIAFSSISVALSVSTSVTEFLRTCFIGGLVSFWTSEVLKALTDNFSGELLKVCDDRFRFVIVALGCLMNAVWRESSKCGLVILLAGFANDSHTTYRFNQVLMGAAVGFGYSFFDTIQVIALVAVNAKSSAEIFLAAVSRCQFPSHGLWTIASVSNCGRQDFNRMKLSEFIKALFLPSLLQFTRKCFTDLSELYSVPDSVKVVFFWAVNLASCVLAARSFRCVLQQT